MSSLNGTARIHGVIKVTRMAWHAAMAVGEGGGGWQALSTTSCYSTGVT